MGKGGGGLAAVSTLSGSADELHLRKRRRLDDCDFLGDYGNDDEHSEQSEPNSHPSSDTFSRTALELEYKAWLGVPETRGTDVTGSTDLLAWWKMNKIQFPTISKFNQKISASSTPSERAFSRVKLIQDRQRWNLLPECLELCVMLKHSAWVLHYYIVLDTVNCIQILIALVCAINYAILYVYDDRCIKQLDLV